jgi:multidrug efflux system outer membrane protein
MKQLKNQINSNMKINKIIVFPLLIFLSGCMLGPNFKKPKPETPQSYIYADTLQADADSVLNLKWWDLFTDPVLDTLVSYAIKNNKDMLIAASRVEEARASLGFIKADIYPRLDLQASAARGNLAGALKLESASSQYYIAPVLNWEIDFWGKFRRANEAARAQLMASLYSYRTVQISLISEVISTYFMLLDFRRRLEISQHTLESRLHSLDIIQKRYDKGIIPEIDLNQSQIQKEIAAASIPATERFPLHCWNADRMWFRLNIYLRHKMQELVWLRQCASPHLI